MDPRRSVRPGRDLDNERIPTLLRIASRTPASPYAAGRTGGATALDASVGSRSREPYAKAWIEPPRTIAATLSARAVP